MLVEAEILHEISYLDGFEMEDQTWVLIIARNDKLVSTLTILQIQPYESQDEEMEFKLDQKYVMMETQMIQMDVRETEV